jgi:hypothetical protein
MLYFADVILTGKEGVVIIIMLVKIIIRYPRFATGTWLTGKPANRQTGNFNLFPSGMKVENC